MLDENLCEKVNGSHRLSISHWSLVPPTATRSLSISCSYGYSRTKNISKRIHVSITLKSLLFITQTLPISNAYSEQGLLARSGCGDISRRANQESVEFGDRLHKFLNSERLVNKRKDYDVKQSVDKNWKVKLNLTETCVADRGTNKFVWNFLIQITISEENGSNKIFQGNGEYWK